MPRSTDESIGRRGQAVPVPGATIPDEPAVRERAGTTALPAGVPPRETHRPARRPPEAAVNISAVERAVSVAGGALLALSGLSRRSWTGTSLAGLGAFLIYRGARGHSYVYERMGIHRANAPIEVEQALTINRPPEDVYGFWRQLENLPRFMRHLQSVKQTSPTRSHWTAQTALTGRALEWDSEITEDKPSELIRWRSLPDGSIRHSGEVRFKRAPGGRGTEVHVHMEYRPRVGVALGAAMYPFTRQTLKEEIRRLKQVMEAGEIPTTEGQPSGRGRKA